MQHFIDIFDQYYHYGVLALVLTMFATPLAASLARRFGVMDLPDDQLKPHEKPTPYLGGVAICVGWATAAVVALFWIERIEWPIVLGIVIGGVAMSFMGLMDDLFEIPAKVRLMFGAVIIAIVLSATGTGAGLVSAVTGPFGLDLPGYVARPLSLIAGLAIVLGACNSTNLIDGLDGLCAGVTAIISLGFYLLATHWAAYGEEVAASRLVLAIAMFGAALGFLPLNFNPARIFMGDAGSILVGYNCGMLLLLFADSGLLKFVIGGLLIFSLPIFDTALAIVRRWRCGRPILEGDRSHFYDQLVDRGLSVRKVVTISYALAAFYALAGLSPIWIRTRWVLVLYLAVGLLTALAVIGARMVRVDESERPTDGS